MGTNFGEPSYVAVKLAALRGTGGGWGMLFAITASCACGVPGTEASTRPAGLCSGIFAKSDASWPPGTYSHGPSAERARNHRPEMRTYMSCDFNSRNRCALVLVAYSSS